MLKRLIALFLLVTLTTPLSAALYTWRDGGGVIHISDKPPGEQADDSTPEVKKIEVAEFTTVNTRQLPQTPIDLSGLTDQEGEESAALRSVIMYTTAWCNICKHAKQYMTQKKIPYVEKDIEKSLEARKEFRELGGDGVPLILLGDQVMAGFSRVEFEAFYKR